MRISWGKFFRRVATAFFICGATAWSSAVCYASNAADDATNAAYDNGWQAGDNGGFGFGPWNFDGNYNPGGVLNVDAFPLDPANDLGRAWRLGNNPGGAGGAVAKAGRSVPLQVGETLSVVVDNPGMASFYRGLIIRLNTGGESLCSGGVGCTTAGNTAKERLSAFVFNFSGQPIQPIQVGAGSGGGPTSLLMNDTDQGARFEFSLIGPESYAMRITPLENASLAYTTFGSLQNAGSGPIDWLELTFFGDTSDPSNPVQTDMYVSSMQISQGVVPEPGSASLMVVGGMALLGAMRSRRPE